MISFVPTLYEDEILYSFISRYHQRSGNIKITDTLEDLFSISHLKCNIYLPGYIDNLVNNFPINCKYKSKDIILNNTLYPFFTFFDSNEFSNKIFNLMKNSDNNDIRSKSGTTNTKMNPIYFKFCNECIEEDINMYGETYWHRIHQAPGVFVCHKHNTILQNSNVKINNRNIREYITPNKNNCIFDDKIKYSENIKQKLYNLSKNVALIMNGNTNKKPINWYKNNYINALKIKKFATINDTLRVDNLINAFREYYTDDFLNLISCSIDESTYDNWLVDILKKPRERHHTLKHLLVIDFLGYQVEEIIDNEIKYRPFGNPPWPCLNKLCDKYRDEEIKDVRLTYYSKADNLVGSFKCNTCGFSYSRRGPDIDKKDMYNFIKIKDLGDLWRAKLKELVLDEDVTIVEMKKILNVNKTTIYKNAEKLNLPIYTRRANKNSREEVNVKVDKRRSNKNYRKKWLNLIKNNPNKSKTELRNLDKATYFWLYHNDKSWLDEVSLKLKKNISPKSSVVDWEKRDNEILELIRTNMRVKLNLDNKPEKISINLIARIINRPLLYYMRTGNVPKTKKYVMSIIDDSDSYAKKRIEWAVNHIKNHDSDLLTVDNIIKTSGIPWYQKQEYRNYIQNILEVN